MKEENSIFRFLATFSFFGISVLIIPFLFTYLTIDPVLIPRFLTLAILLLLFTIYISIQSVKPISNIDFSIVRRIIFPAFICFLFFSALSLIKAINITEGMFELTKIFLAILFLLVATIMLNESKNGILILTRLTTISGLLLSIIGICQYYNLAFRFIPGNFVPSSTMTNINLSSSALFLTFPFILYGVFHFFGFWRIIGIVSLVLNLFLIVVSRTRSVWAAMTISTIVVILLVTIFLRKFKISESLFYKKRFLQISIIIAAATLISVITMLNRATENPLTKTSFSGADESISSVAERFILWGKTIQIVKGNPILGVGLGNWKIVFPNYGTEGMRTETGVVHFQRPHNDYLWVLSESGVFGLVCYLSIFIIAIFYIYKIIFKSSQNDYRAFAILMLLGIVGYMTISIFSYPKERIAHIVYLILMIASVSSIYHRLFPINKKENRIAILSLLISSFLLLLVAVLVGCGRLKGEIHTKRALAARRAHNCEAVISEVNKAESYFYNMDPMSTPIFWYRGVANFSLNRMDEAFVDFKRSYELHPYHIHVLNNLATCYEMKGDHQSAIDYYNNALLISPKFEEALINLSAVYYNITQYEKAYKTIIRCDKNSINPRVSLYLNAIRDKLKEGGTL